MSSRDISNAAVNTPLKEIRSNGIIETKEWMDKEGIMWGEGHTVPGSSKDLACAFTLFKPRQKMDIYSWIPQWVVTMTCC